MKRADYRILYERLNRPEDIETLHKTTGLDKEMLLVIYTQKTVRNVTRRFYQVKKHSRKLLWQWSHGQTLMQLANNWYFPATLIALFVLLEKKYTRKQFWQLLSNPEKVHSKRLRKELIEVGKKDLVYSPKAVEIQYARGDWGEQKLRKWLDGQNISYRTENELRKRFTKTPDCLLTKPIFVDGTDIWWIESKASFGDEIEIRKNMRRQLIPYTELFGSGMVVYWFGFVEEFQSPEGIKIVDEIFFR